MMAREESVPLEAERVRMTVAEPRIGVAETPEFQPRIGVAEEPFVQATPRVGLAEPTEVTPRVGMVEPTEVTPLQRADALQPTEAFQRADALQPTEAFQRADALQPTEAFQRTDALQPTEAFQRADALQPTEAFQRADALQPTEAFQRADALQPTETRRMVDAQPLNLTAAQPVELGRLRDSASPLQPLRGRTAAVAANPVSASQPAGGGGGGGASAGSGFRVDPAQYQAAVSPLLAAADQISQLVTSLTGFLSSMEANKPWGNDESGKQFAEGDKGYLKYTADTQKSLKGLPDGLHFVADGLKAMAQGYQNAEDSAISDLNRDDDQLQAGPAIPQSPNIPGSPTLPIPPRATLGDIARGKNR
ncbi:hypothetical protein [Kitasatospora sp. NPDC001175]|uniref:hypothetical protein n=1 Tax=Kitasatospora sp. NPDC001175 TaxID=3157103 RepID=UPI003D08F226